MPIKKTLQDIQKDTISDNRPMMDTVSAIPSTRKTVKSSTIKSDIIADSKEEMESQPLSVDNNSKDNASNIPNRLISKQQQLIQKTISFVKEIKPIYLIVVSLLFILLIVFLFINPFGKKDTAQYKAEEARIEVETVKKELAKHIILPENEEVDIRKITQKIDDPFFQNASINDYLIIFYKNRIAFIYSVDKDIIVNAGVVFIDPKTASTTSNSTKR